MSSYSCVFHGQQAPKKDTATSRAMSYWRTQTPSISEQFAVIANEEKHFTTDSSSRKLRQINVERKICDNKVKRIPTITEDSVTVSKTDTILIADSTEYEHKGTSPIAGICQMSAIAQIQRIENSEFEYDLEVAQETTRNIPKVNNKPCMACMCMAVLDDDISLSTVNINDCDVDHADCEFITMSNWDILHTVQNQ